MCLAMATTEKESKKMDDLMARYQAARDAIYEAERSGKSKSTMERRWKAFFAIEDEMVKREMFA